MVKDSIVEDVRSARQKLFDDCNEDLNALLDRFQEQEKLDQDRLISDIPPKTDHGPGTTPQREVGSTRQHGG